MWNTSDRPALDRMLKPLCEDVEQACEHRSKHRKRKTQIKGHAQAALLKRNAAPLESARHDRKCSVCRHPACAEIERDFALWRSAETIAKQYGIAHHSSIYRHAHATGLFARRATHLKISLSPLIEQAMVVPVTADSIIRAVALFARLNDRGEWIAPPRRAARPSSRRSAATDAEIQTTPNRETISTMTRANSIKNQCITES